MVLDELQPHRHGFIPHSLWAAKTRRSWVNQKHFRVCFTVILDVVPMCMVKKYYSLSPTVFSVYIASGASFKCFLNFKLWSAPSLSDISDSIILWLSSRPLWYASWATVPIPVIEATLFCWRKSSFLDERDKTLEFLIRPGCGDPIVISVKP